VRFSWESPWTDLVLLPPEGASLCEPSFAPSWLTQDSGAACADHHGLGPVEHSGDPVASGALDIHEEGVWVLDQPLQLVLALFLPGLGVEQIGGERHFLNFVSEKITIFECANSDI